jgi:nitrate reductase NapE component
MPAAVAPAPPLVTAPPTSGNNAVKIILIVVAVIVGLGIVGAGAFGFLVWRVAHAVHVSSSGKEVSINTSSGSIRTNSSETYTAADLGTDLYPGATSGKGSMRMSLPTGTMVTAVYVTSDSKDQVVAFYKEKFGSGASVIESQDGAVISATKGEQESVVVTVTANSSEYGGKTQVAIVHTTSNKPS